MYTITSFTTFTGTYTETNEAFAMPDVLDVAGVGSS